MVKAGEKKSAARKEPISKPQKDKDKPEKTYKELVNYVD